jgi:hypothetical protein
MDTPGTSRVSPKLSLLLPVLLSSVMLTNCGSALTRSVEQQAAQAPATSSMGNADQATSSTLMEKQAAEPEAIEPLGTRPQLVKNAELTMVVKSVTESLRGVNGVVRHQKGDILGLQDFPPTGEGARHTLSMQIRVPQARLDAALAALSQIGTVQRQSLSAEDVGDQLVDFEARLRNLRKTETTLLQIMERSGSVGDVLKVAEQLSRTREQAEQISAQLATLKNRVTYSRITLVMEEVLASVQPERSVVSQFQETWEQATRSVANLTIGFGKLGLWLLAYTPYWFILGIVLAWIGKRLQSGKRPQPVQSDAVEDLQSL